jgi:release factor glutamine methyltransferase
MPAAIAAGAARVPRRMTSTTQEPGPGTVERRVERLGTLDIAYDDRVLRPRPWTAAQSEWAAELLQDAAPGPVLELCTGAGHIGLLAILGNQRRLVAVDADPIACEYARANAADAGLAGRVEVRNAMLDGALEPGERFPMIIADPPWVPSARTGDHPEDPVLAIDGGEDGLMIARLCVEVAAAHLDDGGVLLLQVGDAAQAATLGTLLDDRSGLAMEEVRQPSPTGVLVLVRRVSRT